MTRPITPQEIHSQIPDEVIEIFNTLIFTRWRAGRAYFRQDEVVDLICAKLQISSDEVFARGLLDVEPIFKAAGWKVDYEKVMAGETGHSNFTFSPAPKSRRWG